MSIKNRIQRASTGSVKVLPYVAGTLSVLLCLWCATESLGFGLSRLYAARAFENNDLSLANRAVLLARSDPEIYRVRAAVLAQQERFTEAAIDLEHALVLSPRDADLWINLGDDRAQLQDTNGALRAYFEATRLAPGYAHSHWLIGNCLLKAGRLDEAFAELRLASTIMPALFVKNIELAWQTYNGEPEAIKQALQPQTVHERIALALFFSNHSLPDQAARLMRDARHLPEEEKLSLLRELLDTDRFAEAYEVWSTGREESVTEHWSGAGSITDGSFEGKFAVDDPGFGWKFNHDLKTVTASLDQGDSYSGKQSLRLDWHGDPDHSVRIVEQLVLVAPKTRYRLSFASRTQSLTTICLPLITITSRKGEAEILLGQSPPLPQGSSEWRKYVVDFATADNSRAVIISVTRTAGPDGSCPIFGSMWIDDFSLEKM